MKKHWLILTIIALAITTSGDLLGAHFKLTLENATSLPEPEHTDRCARFVLTTTQDNEETKWKIMGPEEEDARPMPGVYDCGKLESTITLEPGSAAPITLTYDTSISGAATKYTLSCWITTAPGEHEMEFDLFTEVFYACSRSVKIDLQPYWVTIEKEDIDTRDKVPHCRHHIHYPVIKPVSRRIVDKSKSKDEEELLRDDTVRSLVIVKNKTYRRLARLILQPMKGYDSTAEWTVLRGEEERVETSLNFTDPEDDVTRTIVILEPGASIVLGASPFTCSRIDDLAGHVSFYGYSLECQITAPGAKEEFFTLLTKEFSGVKTKSSVSSINLKPDWAEPVFPSDRRTHYIHYPAPDKEAERRAAADKGRRGKI
jgi:hypothetical protein